MKVIVTRTTIATWKATFEKLGADAVVVDVPATMPGMMFRGVYTDRFKKEALVAWPVDRPPGAQDEFARELAAKITQDPEAIAYPVKEFTRPVDRLGLSAVNKTGDS